MRHANVAMFIPHNGCPNQCSFCDQRYITGSKNQVSPNQVYDVLLDAKNNLSGKDIESEIAFFGGSFTAIDKEYMMSLLDTAYEFVKDGCFKGIRISTRPDAIDEEILNILKERGVSSIELGAQSMDDEVLRVNRRGHSSLDVIKSSELIKKYGFSLGLQMMTGLYKSSILKDIETAEKFINIRPETVRIYPTIIMKNTLLADLYYKGEYATYSLEDTIGLCSKLLRMFEKENIEVIRLGLHDTESMKENMVSGPWHPALSELCQSYNFYKDIVSFIEENNISYKNIDIFVNPSCISKFIGQKRENIKKFKNIGLVVKVKPDKSIKVNDFRIEKGR